MTLFFFKILITNLFYLILGKLICFKLFKKEIINIEDISIFGILIASFIALLINFLLPLNVHVNSIFIIIVILFFIPNYKIILQKDLIFLSIVTILSFFLILYDNEYRPDAGLYHLPYTQIINENNIIIGLANLHFRFGHTSIIQYLSALNYNFITGKEGILIPLASLVTFIYFYFFYDLFKFINKKEDFSIGKLFSVLIIIYISYKINRYSEFGNDAPAHIFLFYVISKFLYLKNFSTKQIWNFYIYSVFCFLNKIFFIFIFLIPFFLILKNKKSLTKLILSFPSFIMLAWLIKNILISGCMIYPMKITCLENLPWMNLETVEKVQIEGEAWAKAWPENKDKTINMADFSQKFNWIEAWASNHLVYILKTLTPYLIFVLFFLTFSVNKINRIKFFNFFKDQKIQILSLISIIGIFSFFLKFPIYRYGYSYLIIFSFIFFGAIFNDLNIKKLINYSKIIFIFCIFIICFKQFLRIYKYNETRNYIPSHIFVDKKNYEKKYNKVGINENFQFYLSKDECFYGLAPCTNSIYWKKQLDYKKKWNFNLILSD
ncbi:LIC_10190 family membrane protein [Candidatus Pelagibacter sp. HIMB1542]|uniref:LIC_10190 family membrane protein n=1 Tax=Candidatus Pelagibacter sp. HIMB1542 TaxID=3413346 RepID=UPI003F84335C